MNTRRNFLTALLAALPLGFLGVKAQAKPTPMCGGQLLENKTTVRRCGRPAQWVLNGQPIYLNGVLIDDGKIYFCASCGKHLGIA